MRTGVCLNSGWPETGSTFGWIRLPTLARAAYWSFQWIESALYLALAGLLAGFGLWRIQRHVS